MDKQEKQPCRNQAQAKIHEHQKETDKQQVKRRSDLTSRFPSLSKSTTDRFQLIMLPRSTTSLTNF